jgi:two-component system CheB/CheR fusion protein
MTGFTDEISMLSADKLPVVRLPHSHAVRSAYGLTSFLGLLSFDGTLLEANESASTPPEFSSDAALGLPFWEAAWWSWSPIVQQRLRETIARVASGRVLRYNETALIRRNQLITVDLACAPVLKAGRARALICSVIDLSGPPGTPRSTGVIR